ncbi:MAG TPA: hypothetical protein VNR87_06370 [Flavisolibacter sp.]|nr:hypothetical protein [Flavisolibacter sp.]
MADFKVTIDEIEFTFQKHAGLKEAKYLVFCDNHIFHMEQHADGWKILGGVPDWILGMEGLLSQTIRKYHQSE